MRKYRIERLAREVALLLKDGRPTGCTCPPNPGRDALPSDNRHHSSLRCPYTKIEQEARSAKP